MKIHKLDKKINKVKEKDAKVALMITQFFPEFNNDNDNSYINFSINNLNERGATVALMVMHSSNKRALLSGRIPGSIPGGGASLNSISKLKKIMSLLN